MEKISFHSKNESDTTQLGAVLAQSVSSGSVIGLNGTLGAGKTRLVQAIAAALGAEPGTVVSPTFVLIQQYQTTPPIYHIDTYRLADEDEFLELGVDEYFEGEGITVVEWADRMTDCLPIDRIDITIEVEGEQERLFVIHATGPTSQKAVDRLASLIGNRL
jgi:tRNA threonylcarbamoyladenosine biosynthesis protein TsaE